MSDKTIKTRIIHKHAVESDWEKATNFKPLQGEIIVYDIDANYSYQRLKIGDGITLVNDLPFADVGSLSEEIDNLQELISTANVLAEATVTE